jgi:chromosome segregation ATPase
MEKIKKKSTKIGYESITDDNNLRIIMNNDEIIFFVVLGLPSFNYIKTYKYNEIIKELNIPECKDIEEVFDYLMKSGYTIIEEEKKLIINNNKEIQLKEINMEYGELIKVLMDEIKELKDQNDQLNEKINEIIKKNKDREIKINKLEKKYNELNKKINELEENKKDKEKINLIYRVKEEGTYNIFGKDFVEKNKDNIDSK